MAKRSKQVVWHKKRQKFISPTLLHPHHEIKEDKNQPVLGTEHQERKKVFVKELLSKIRRAVRE